MIKKLNNENWNETVEFSKNLKPRDISKIKEVFYESDTTKKYMCDGFFVNQNKYEKNFKKKK